MTDLTRALLDHAIAALDEPDTQPAIATCFRTIPATPVCPAYEALCVDRGGEPMPIAIFNGRQCYVESSGRTRAKEGWRFYSYVIIRYVDDGSSETVPAGHFAKGARNP